MEIALQIPAKKIISAVYKLYHELCETDESASFKQTLEFLFEQNRFGLDGRENTKQKLLLTAAIVSMQLKSNTKHFQLVGLFGSFFFAMLRILFTLWTSSSWSRSFLTVNQYRQHGNGLTCILYSLVKHGKHATAATIQRCDRSHTRALVYLRRATDTRAPLFWFLSLSRGLGYSKIVRLYRFGNICRRIHVKRRTLKWQEKLLFGKNHFQSFFQSSFSTISLFRTQFSEFLKKTFWKNFWVKFVIFWRKFWGHFWKKNVRRIFEDNFLYKFSRNSRLNNQGLEYSKTSRFFRNCCFWPQTTWKNISCLVPITKCHIRHF